jgi:hypothetical protein
MPAIMLPSIGTMAQPLNMGVPHWNGYGMRNQGLSASMSFLPSVRQAFPSSQTPDDVRIAPRDQVKAMARMTGNSEKTLTRPILTNLRYWEKRTMVNI